MMAPSVLFLPHGRSAVANGLPARRRRERCQPLRLALALLLAVACRDEAPTSNAPGGSAGSSASATEAAQRDALEKARQAALQSLNPKGLPVYSGPVGGVRGTVKVTGDPPPLRPEMVAKLPAEGCDRAHELQRKVYRQGADRTLADVLVTVTEYEGFLPPQDEAVRVNINGCAFDTRVLAMTYGQRLDVYNRDPHPYMPRLIGAPSYALRVAIPGGGPVPLFAPRPGPFLVADQTREYVRADLYVLNYPTFDVTGLDGQFEITGVPVGTVRVTAFASAFGKAIDREVTIRAGEIAELQFELPFSEDEYQAKTQASGGPAPDSPAPQGSTP